MILDYPTDLEITPSEWRQVDDAMGEHMIPTGYARIRDRGIIQVPALERQWRGSCGTIWLLVPAN